MRFSLSWLREHLDTNASAQEVADKLTDIGLEVEEVIDRSQELTPFTVAEIVTAEPHPNADRLRVCSVNTGTETLQIVCGAPNARAGIKVILARIGTTIPGSGLTLKATRIRDVDSQGMLCSAAEMGLSGDSEGIVELPAEAPLGTPFAACIGADDPIIEIAVTPNRGDALSVRGIARDLAAAGLGVLRPLATPTLPPPSALNPYRIALNTSDCQYFSLRLLRGVRNGDSPRWLQQRLRAAGLTPISLVVDVTNYVLFTIGQPMHAFDASTINGELFTLENLAAPASFLALNDKDYTLPEGALVIRDAAGVISLAGIMGGKASACQPETTDILLEAALFNPLSIARTGRALNLNTDARYRFERGVDPHAIDTAMAMATALILEYGGGTASPIVNDSSLSSPAAPIPFDPASLARKTGLELPVGTIHELLLALGMTVNTSATTWQVTPPSWRHDIHLPIDIVEEIARLHGYAAITAIPPTPPATPPVGKVRTKDASVIRPPASIRREEHLRQCLAEVGLSEALSWAFCDAGLAAQFADLDESAALLNPISQDLSHLRPTLIIPLLQAAKRNNALGTRRGGLFEIGAQYTAGRPFAQARMVAGLRWGQHAARHWRHPHARAVDAFDAKADALSAIAALGGNPDAPVTRPDAPRYYHPGQSGTLTLGGKVVLGYFGVIHPQILKQLDIDCPVVAFELAIDAVPTPKAKGSAKPPLSLSPYPAVERDFAFIVPVTTLAQDVVQAIRLVDKALIQDVTLFDVYQGNTVPEGYRSLGFAVTLQPTQATLTDLQIQEVSDKIIAAVKAKTGAGIRQ